MKPHIKLVRKRLWSCSGHDITRQGVSPAQAYKRWCLAVAAMAAPTHVPNIKARKTRAAPKSKPAAKAAPKHVPAAPIKNPIAPGAAGQATYLESIVQQVHGTNTRNTYVPPASLLRNRARVALVQPPLISVSTPVRVSTILSHLGGHP